MATAENTASMNEPNSRDPYNNNSYGTLVDSPYVNVDLPILDVNDFNDRIIRGYEEGTGRKRIAGRPVDRPLADSRRHGDAARLQLRRPGDPGIHHRELHRLHGLRDRMPRYGHSGQGLAEIGSNEKLQDIPDEEDREMFDHQWSKTRKYYDGPKKKGQRGWPVRHHHRPQQMQGLRRVRHRLRRLGSEDDPQDRKGHGRHSQRPPVLQKLRPQPTSNTSTTIC